MQSFDQSLKYLLHHEPADFIGFALGDRRVRVLEAVPTVLPARGRDVDGAYLIALDPPGRGASIPESDERLVHIEFHRRHQSATDLGTDIVEAQARLLRREGKRVATHVWDLYGNPEAPVRQENELVFGADGSTCVYQRINLRGMSATELLAQAPPELWALAPLTRDGASKEVIERARDAIDTHTRWVSSERADHLAVLCFVAEAERMPGGLVEAVIAKERLMEESRLYLEIFGEGKAEGEAKGKAESILTVLSARGIPVSDTIRARILGCADVATLDTWVRRAAVASTAAAVVRARPPARSSGPARHAHKT